MERDYQLDREFPRLNAGLLNRAFKQVRTTARQPIAGTRTGRKSQ
jgi:hypothetical protein